VSTSTEQNPSFPFQLLRFLRKDFVPHLREVVDEDERVIQITAMIGNTVISPVAKQRAR
jgi:hypothetical protein